MIIRSVVDSLEILLHWQVWVGFIFWFIVMSGNYRIYLNMQEGKKLLDLVLAFLN